MACGAATLWVLEVQAKTGAKPRAPGPGLTLPSAATARPRSGLAARPPTGTGQPPYAADAPSPAPRPKCPRAWGAGDPPGPRRDQPAHGSGFSLRWRGRWRILRIGAERPELPQRPYRRLSPRFTVLPCAVVVTVLAVRPRMVKVNTHSWFAPSGP